MARILRKVLAEISTYIPEDATHYLGELARDPTYYQVYDIPDMASTVTVFIWYDSQNLWMRTQLGKDALSRLKAIPFTEEQQ